MNASSVFSCALLAFLACSVLGQSNNVTWGIIGPSDRLLDRASVYKQYEPLKIVTEDYVYPKRGYTNVYNITGIRVLDQINNGTGGYVTFLEGGVGTRNVTIRLQSRQNYGFNFIVEIFGR